jgi:arginine/ornithine N-succinyltransferase beta subunit
MNEKIENVFHGFLNLGNLEKLKLVEEINEYFDSNEREPIREAHDLKFEKIDFTKTDCICCSNTRKKA